jgi:4-hydroxyphenylacetate 3-monooxygenase
MPIHASRISSSAACAGGWEDIRAQSLTGAERAGDLKAMEALVDQCMADYDEDGWIGETWLTTGTGQPSR